MTDEATVNGDERLPASFIRFRDLVRVDLKQILTLDKKPPMNAATLLILVACEALSKLFGRAQEHDVFARDRLSRRGVPYHVGAGLFDALRNGLAHDYTTGRIVVGRDEIRPTLAWKDGRLAHLKLTGARLEQGHLHFVPFGENTEKSPRLCVAIDVLWEDLNALFQELEAKLKADPELAMMVEDNALALLRGEEARSHPEGPALAAWREYVDRERWEGTPS
jgi:hypothetical protein